MVRMKINQLFKLFSQCLVPFLHVSSVSFANCRKKFRYNGCHKKNTRSFPQEKISSHTQTLIGSFIKIMITINCLRRLGKTAEKVARRTHVASASLVAATALLYCVDMGRLAEGILKSGGSTLHCFDTLFQ